MNKMILSALLAACCLATLVPVYGEGAESVELVSYDSDKLMALVVRAGGGNLEYRIRDCGVWGSWVDLGGICTSPVSAVSWGPGRVDMFVRGYFNKMWHRSFEGGVWSGWQDFGGILPYDFKIGCVSHAPNSVTAFALGVGGEVFYYHYGGGGWSGWQSLGGIGTSGVVGCSWGPNHITMFVRGTNYKVWQRTWDAGSYSSWGGWVKLGNLKVKGEIACASWGLDRLDVFAVQKASPNPMMHNWYSGGLWQTSWENYNGIFTTDAAVVSAKEGHLAVFGRGITDSVWTAIMSGGTWLTGWVEMYGAAKGAVVATVHQGEIHVASATTANVQHTYFQADWEFI